MNRLISVHIVDDYKLVVQGIKAVLNSVKTVKIQGYSHCGEDALRAIDNSVDVLIADVSLGDMNGIELTKKVKKKFANLKVLAVSRFNDYSVINSMLCAGANGYIVKDEPNYNMEKAIQYVYEDRLYLCPSSQRIIEQHKKNSSDPQPDLSILSKRELQIIKLIARGLANHTIAEQLFISTRTVETHRKNIMTKLKINKAAGLVKFAFESKLMEL